VGFDDKTLEIFEIVTFFKQKAKQKKLSTDLATRARKLLIL